MTISISGVIVDLIIISIIISTSYLSYKRGLSSVLYSIIAVVISIMIMFALYKPVSNTIISNTSLDENIANGIKNVLPEGLVNNGETINENSSEYSKGSTKIINGYVQEAIQKSESDVVGYVSLQLAYFLIRILTMIILYIVSRIILVIIRFATNIISNLPIIKTFDKGGGLIYGVIKSFLIVFVILAILSAFSPIISSWGVIGAIERSYIGKALYNNNFLLNLIMK